MVTTWDLTDSVEAPIVNTQGTRVRPSARPGSVVIIGVAVGAMFSTPTVSTVRAENGWVSAPIASVETFYRKATQSPQRTLRKTRDAYEPDAREGLSTLRLSRTLHSICTRVDEEAVEVDFSFG